MFLKLIQKMLDCLCGPVPARNPLHPDALAVEDLKVGMLVQTYFVNRPDKFAPVDPSMITPYRSLAIIAGKPFLGTNGELYVHVIYLDFADDRVARTRLLGTLDEHDTVSLEEYLRLVIGALLQKVPLAISVEVGRASLGDLGIATYRPRPESLLPRPYWNWMKYTRPASSSGVFDAV